MSPIPKNPRLRFESKYQIQPSGCWLWIASVNRHGYGRFNFDGKDGAAHRFAYQEFVGPIPEGMSVCHTCDNSRCVNPDHLWVGTCQQNQTDMAIKRRSTWGQKNGRCKLSPWQVLEIRKSSISDRKLASNYGVHATTIRSIKSKKIWQHLPDGESAKNAITEYLKEGA